MSEPSRSCEFFETLSQVLLRCWIIGLSLGFVSYAVYMLGGDFIFQMQGKAFGLNRHELDLIYCAGFGLLKLCVIVFFMIPWLAIRLTLRKPTNRS